jgi:hypothetical protein
MKSPEQRFLEKVSIPVDLSECWEWTASKKKGYGQFKWNGKMVLAHRYSYLMFNGELIDGLVIMHRCDNPSCVNPNHLDQGTYKDNMQDCLSKGRHKEANKTHCPHGHEYTEENTRNSLTSGRQCLTCARAYDRRRRKNNKK